VVGIARWLGHIVNPGRHTNALAQTVDLLPTFAAIAGVALPSDRTYDGVDLSDVLYNKSGARGHTTMFHPGSGLHKLGEIAAMRWNNYKAHFAITGASPCIMKNDADEIAMEFATRTAAIAEAAADLTPQSNPPLPLIFDLDLDPAEAHPIDHSTIPDVVKYINDAFAAFEASVKSDELQSVTNYSTNSAYRACGNHTEGNSCCRTHRTS
jgi:arylsulfatase A-like enzyme